MYDTLQPYRSARVILAYQMTRLRVKSDTERIRHCGLHWRFIPMQTRNLLLPLSVSIRVIRAEKEFSEGLR